MPMHTEKLTRAVQKDLARLTHTSPDDWFLVFRARHGVEATLQALAKTRGRGEVLTQPFTCTTALNPILSAGHIPVYIDTSYDDLSLDTDKLQSSAESRALVMQHSFGIESNIKKARTFANKHALLLLEDSAHCIGFMSRDNDGEPLADVSIHSFGVEKMLPTKFGGAIWINPAIKDHELRDAIRQTLGSLPKVDRHTRGRARRYRFCNRLLNHTPPVFEKLLRSLLIKTGLFEPAIMPEELQGKNYGKPGSPSVGVLKEMQSGLKVHEKLMAKRRIITSFYTDKLPTNLSMPKSVHKNDRALVRFPVLCENNLEATRLFQILREEGHYSGRWYSPIIFPQVPSPELYNYDSELCPVAEDISARILNLPTNITIREAQEIIDVLHRETD